MSEIVTMPRLSDTMTEGVVAKWHKKVGDKVEEGDLLADIETDKATMEFEAFQEGELLHIGVKEGESAPVDSILCILGDKGEDVEALIKEHGGGKSGKEEKKEKPEDKQEKKAKEEKTEERKPADAKAEKVEEDDEDEDYEVGKIPDSDSRIFASPLAKKLADERGIDLSMVSGTGDSGRIVKRDIENYRPRAATAGFAPVSAEESHTDAPVSQMRKTIARRLSESKFEAPHFYLTMEIRMDEAVKARKVLNDSLGVKISFNDIVLKAVAMALTKHPKVNSSWLGDKIRTYNHVNVGVAVAVDEGLLVPVVRHANLKGMAQISEEVRTYAQKAKDKKLQPSDWEGNTFTISNLGMFGIEEFTAIINPPDSCILAVGGIKQTPVVDNGEIKVGHMMKVTLSCDHRVVDGATGSAFLQTVKGMLENPLQMMA